MKTVATNLPQLASNVKVRLKKGVLTRVFIAPAKPVEEEKPAADSVLLSPEYAENAKAIDAGQAVLEAAFRTVKVRERSVPTSAPVAAIVIAAKLAKAQSVIAAPVFANKTTDLSQMGNLNGSNKGFNLFR